MLLLVRVRRLASAPLASRVVLLGIARATAAEQRTTRDLKETMASTTEIELEFPLVAIFSLLCDSPW